MVSGTMSGGIPPPASLLRAQAAVLHPPAASVVPSHRGSVQGAVSPCGEEDLPDVVLHLCPCVLGPLPRRLVRCFDPFLPSRHRPSPRSDRVGAPPCPCSDFSTAPFARLQSFADVQARRCAHHPGRSYRYGITPHGSRGLYVRASRGSLPPHAPDRLAVRIGPLTAEDVHLIRCAALSAAPRTLGFTCCRKPQRRRSGATVLVVKGSWYIFLAPDRLGVPGRPMLQQGVEHCQELLQTGRQGDFLDLPRSEKPLVKDFAAWVAARGGAWPR